MATGIAEMLAAKEPEVPEGEEAMGEDMGLEAAADELIKGMHARDPKMVVSALRNAFAIMGSEPPEEAGGMGLEE